MKTASQRSHEQQQSGSSASGFSIPAPSFMVSSTKAPTTATREFSKRDLISTLADQSPQQKNIGSADILELLSAKKFASHQAVKDSSRSEAGSSRGSTTRPVLSASGFSTRRNKAVMSEVDRLELENKLMEERLLALKDNLSKQKEKRGTAESIWKGGNSTRGSLNTYAVDVLHAKKQAKAAVQVQTQPKKKRYDGLMNEATQELQNFEAVVEKRLAQLDTLHSQSTGASGMPADPSLIIAPAPKVSASSQPETKETTQTHDRIIQARPPPKPESPPEEYLAIETPVITPAPPSMPPPAAKMWKVPSRSETPQKQPESSKPPEQEPNSFLANLQSWTATAAATAAEIPSSKTLPEGTPSSLRVRRSRVKQIDPPVSNTLPVLPVSQAQTSLHEPVSPQNGGEFNEEESHKSFLSALEQWRNTGKQETRKDEENEHVGGGGVFLSGDFDEGESRASFLDALEEWRNGGSSKKERVKVKVDDDSIGTSTNDSYGIASSTENVLQSTVKMLGSTEGSLSYLDKMLLARYRSATPSNDPVSISNFQSTKSTTVGVSEYMGGSESEDSEDLVSDVFWPPQLNKRYERVDERVVENDVSRSVVQFEVQVLSTEFINRGGVRSTYIVEEPDSEEENDVVL
ncbi:UNVERIFIED_CONTAM: hypothetical protein HDU68_009977 [Siphonaria sp. JEL0065]|nr:hypothetical protein HDU68_009977 [Siphonaria sp. JEL0065]